MWNINSNTLFIGGILIYSWHSICLKENLPFKIHSVWRNNGMGEQNWQRWLMSLNSAMLNGEDAHGSPRHRNQYRAHTRGSSLRARGHPNPVGATPAPPSVAADQRGTNPRADEMRRFGSAAPPAQAPHSQHLPGGCPAPYRAAPPCPRFYCAGTRPRTRPPPYMACPEGAPLGPSPRCPGAGRAGAGGVGGEQGAGSCRSPRARKPAQGDVDVVCPDEAILKAGWHLLSTYLGPTSASDSPAARFKVL